MVSASIATQETSGFPSDMDALTLGNFLGAASLNVGGALNAFSPVKQQIAANAADVDILVIGDSTSNATDEWAYLFADWLGDLYPTHTVEHSLWNDVGNAYDAATVLSTGSGARKIRMWNASVSGSRADYLLGAAKYGSAIGAIDPALIIWNHGHNHVTGVTQPIMQGEISAVIDLVRLAKPNANMAAVIQNPRSDSSVMDLANTVWRAIGAQMPDLLLLDVFSRFEEAGKPAGWYADTTHPNATGQLQWLDVVQIVWRGSVAGVYAPNPAWFSTAIANPLANGELASTGTSAPTSWTVAGTVAFAREGTIVYPGEADSLKMNGSGEAAASISQTISGATLNALKGGNVFLTALQYIPTGADATVGRISVQVNGTGGGTTTSRSNANARDKWKFAGVGPIAVPSDATFILVRLYHDSDASPDTDPVYFQRAILSAGSVPRDMA